MHNHARILPHTVPCRCYYHWDVVAALRHNRSFDLFFSGYILISFGIVMEGIIRFCPHYFGDGMITLSIVVWVRLLAQSHGWGGVWTGNVDQSLMVMEFSAPRNPATNKSPRLVQWAASVIAELICVFIPFLIAYYHTRT